MKKYLPFNKNKIFCLANEVNILGILYLPKNETCMLNIDCSITTFVLYIIHNMIMKQEYNYEDF